MQAIIDGNRIEVRSVKTTRVPFIPERGEMVPASRKDAKGIPNAVQCVTVTAHFKTAVKGGCKFRITQTVTGPLAGLLAFVGSRSGAKWNDDKTRVDFDTFI